jgi:hypothetical protein
MTRFTVITEQIASLWRISAFWITANLILWIFPTPPSNILRWSRWKEKTYTPFFIFTAVYLYANSKICVFNDLNVETSQADGLALMFKFIVHLVKTNGVESFANEEEVARSPFPSPDKTPVSPAAEAAQGFQTSPTGSTTPPPEFVIPNPESPGLLEHLADLSNNDIAAFGDLTAFSEVIKLVISST